MTVNTAGHGWPRLEQSARQTTPCARQNACFDRRFPSRSCWVRTRQAFAVFAMVGKLVCLLAHYVVSFCPEKESALQNVKPILTFPTLFKSVEFFPGSMLKFMSISVVVCFCIRRLRSVNWITAICCTKLNALISSTLNLVICSWSE